MWTNSFGIKGTGEIGSLIVLTSIALDSLGNFYITDSNNHKIQIYNNHHNYISSIDTLLKQYQHT
ncbi:MAG: hypothetical protein AB8U25_03055 [Rickettsiales endosymbiont of Dermacentor nuttalli]